MSEKIQGQIGIKGELPKDVINDIMVNIIQEVVGGIDQAIYANVNCCGDTFFRVDCSDEQFEKICNLVKEKYSTIYEIEILKM